jgi:bifunctional non-homologous end joining protein LigD
MTIVELRTVQSTSLFYRDGSSDKVYRASIVEVEGGYMVNFAYGRRGNVNNYGSKTPGPSTLQKCEQVYNKLISEKKAKGYVEDPDAKPFTGNASVEARDTGYLPQLLNEVEETRLEKLITNDSWVAQEKFDGVRRMIIKDSTGITGANRKGLSITLSDDMIKAVDSLGNFHFALDGEQVGDTFYVFDLLDSTDIYQKRLAHLDTKFKFNDKVKLVKTAFVADTKRVLLSKLRTDNAEGIVFKDQYSFYKPGRPSSGGEQLKFKFVETCSCMVGRVNEGTRSISLNVFDDNLNPVNVGNATVYSNQDLPNPGEIVEVKYLYYYPGGSLFQPVLLGVRDDIQPDDCKLSKLKAKREEVNE